ncbi:MAG: dockerin type I repeat-containing protein, partial [Bacillota bacterium]
DNDQSELGDIDGDGIVGSLDYSILRRALINPDQELELDTADLNQDGMINSMDIALFRQYLTGRRESL